MHTLILPGRSHVISDDMAERVIAAIEQGNALVRLQVEMNGEGSGLWDVAINVRQVIAIVAHPKPASITEPSPALRLVTK